MGSSPCRRIHLLAIAHPVVGKYFQVLKVHKEPKHIKDLSVKKKAKLWFIFWFCNILDRISNFVYVHKKFCNKKLIFGLVQFSVNSFPIFYNACKMCIEAVV